MSLQELSKKIENWVENQHISVQIIFLIIAVFIVTMLFILGVAGAISFLFWTSVPIMKALNAMWIYRVVLAISIFSVLLNYMKDR